MPAWLWAILAGAMTSLLALSKISTRANTCCDFDCEDTGADPTVQEGDNKGELPGQIRELYRRPFMEDSKSEAHILSAPANLQQFIYREAERLCPRDADLRAQFSYKYLENQMSQQKEYRDKCVPIVRRDDQSRRVYRQCYTPQGQRFQQEKKSPRPVPEAQQLPAIAAHPRSELASPQRQKMSKEDSAKMQESQYRGTESIPGNVVIASAGQLVAAFPHQRNITNPETSESLDCCGACVLKCQYQCERPIRPHPEASEKPKCCGACGLKCQYQCQQRAGPQTQGLRPKRYRAATECVGTWPSQGRCPSSRIPGQQNLNIAGQSPLHGARLRNAHSFSPTQRTPIPQNASHRRPMSHPELPQTGQLLHRLANINAKLMKLTGGGPGGALAPRVRGQFTQNYQSIRSCPRRNYGTLYPGYRKDVRARVDNLLSGLIHRTGLCIHVLSDVERFIRHLQMQLRNI